MFLLFLNLPSHRQFILVFLFYYSVYISLLKLLKKLYEY
ncbi:MAG: hypothetical protein MRERC_6c036 [Mycoplasmataceae bacterium RC_NB112A]|nr:MAG: hypothetical protein MRERC_13c037 [Mycoplasmataceae bacterium RC_NB112A]KLL01949.1 MAG: hypothetical protein MRERC_6c036 [Mycoplasmataceae bacterium RC_NB112A]